MSMDSARFDILLLYLTMLLESHKIYNSRSTPLTSKSPKMLKGVTSSVARIKSATGGPGSQRLNSA